MLNEVRTDLASLPFRSWNATILPMVEHVSKILQKGFDGELVLASPLVS